MGFWATIILQRDRAHLIEFESRARARIANGTWAGPRVLCGGGRVMCVHQRYR